MYRGTIRLYPDHPAANNSPKMAKKITRNVLKCPKIGQY